MDTRHAVEGLYATAHWLVEQERFADAAFVFRAMMLAAPEDERVWLGLGICHESIGQHAIAERLYRAGVAFATTPVRCAVAHARTLRAQGRDDDAVLALDRAAEIASVSDDDVAVALVCAERRVAA